MAIISGPPTVSVSGASFTGKGEALELVGDFAYAYNQSEMTVAATTVLEFTTGNYLFVGQVEYVGPIKFTGGTIALGGVGGMSIALAGNVIAYLKQDTNEEDMALPSTYNLIIPPYTAVKIQTINGGDISDYIQTTSITGRIYRG